MTVRDSNRKRGSGAQCLPPDDYLWDGSGPRDEQVAALERALSPLRWQSQPLVRDHPARSRLLPARATPLRAAAALGVLITGAWLLSVFSTSVRDIGNAKEHRMTPTAGATMPVRALQGAPRVGGRKIESEGAIAAGQWLETDAESSAQI